VPFTVDARRFNAKGSRAIPRPSSVGRVIVRGTEIRWMPAGRAMPETTAQVPSVHAAWNGSYALCVDGHAALKLEDEVFLALNADHVLTTRGRRDPGACLLSIYFAPDLLARALETLAPAERELLIPCSQEDSFQLFEHVRDSDRSLASVMRYIAHHASSGIDDPQWYEEQVSFLLRRLLGHEISLARIVGNMTHLKSWKRRETFLRLSRVTDLIHSCYERPLTIEELAAAAHWSCFHMMRAFKAVHATSPYEYLQRRRTQTATRLLCTTDLSVAEVAERTGFNVRTLMRRLQRSRGLGARALRTQTGQSQQSASSRMTTSVVPRVDAATSITSDR
jgi:AraC-like DNA-binding protein